MVIFYFSKLIFQYTKHPNSLTKIHNYNSSGSSEIKGYGVTWHPGTRSFMNFAATSAFDFPISTCLWRTCIPHYIPTV